MELCKPCIICGEPVELTPDEKLSLQYGHNIDSKVCDKCREAVWSIRERGKRYGEAVKAYGKWSSNPNRFKR